MIVEKQYNSAIKQIKTISEEGIKEIKDKLEEKEKKLENLETKFKGIEKYVKNHPIIKINEILDGREYNPRE